MVLSTAAQPNSTYLVWKRFRYPDDKGTTDAIAVPKWVGDTLNPAYALIIDLALLNFWTVFFGIVLYFYLSKKRKKAAKLDPLVPKIWNKRSDLISLVIEAITSLSQTCPNPVVVLILLLCLAGWVGQKATGILVPPLILVNNAAPVDPAAIYVPTIPPNSDSARLANLFALEAPRFLRALGSTAAGAELRKKVDVSEGTLIGQTVNGSDILRIDYKYSATGADMGLQHYPDLTLNVVGSCVTEYGWYNNTATLRDNTGGASTLDYYNIWGNKTADLFKVSLYDGRQPSATFFLGTNSSQGTLAHSNATWAAAISSTDRVSFSPSTDPWYLTGPAIEGDTGARYAVMPGRPPLTCWQDDVWSYQDKNSTVEDLNTIIDISDDFRAILTSILSAPMIYLVGQHLASSALLSATTAIDQLFDAGSSSIHGDIERLVLAAYVATINVLTDTTLYPVGASEKLSNLARDGSAQPLNGIADFVVWSPDVAALSTVAIIVIPSVFVGLWILALILLYWTPARIVNKLDSIGTLATIDDAEPQPNQHDLESVTTPITTSVQEKPPHNESSIAEGGPVVGNKI